MSRTATPTEAIDIEKTVTFLIETLRDNFIPLEIAAPALMVATARLAVHSQETYSFIIDQFRKTMLSARMVVEQKMEGAKQ